MVGGGDVAEPADVGGKGLSPQPSPPRMKRAFGAEDSGAEEEFVDAGFAVGEAIAEKDDVAGEGGIGRDGEVGFGVEAVVHGVVGLGAEAAEAVAGEGTAAVGEDGVVEARGVREGVGGVGLHAVRGWRGRRRPR